MSVKVTKLSMFAVWALEIQLLTILTIAAIVWFCKRYWVLLAWATNISLVVILMLPIFPMLNAPKLGGYTTCQSYPNCRFLARMYFLSFVLQTYSWLPVRQIWHVCARVSMGIRGSGVQMPRIHRFLDTSTAGSFAQLRCKKVCVTVTLVMRMQAILYSIYHRQS